MTSCLTSLGACTVTPADADDASPESPYAMDSGLDYALEFDGVDDYASSGTAGFPFPLDPYTLSLWMSYVSVSDSRQSFLALRRDEDAGIEFGVAGGVLTAWRYYDGSPYAESTIEINAGSWHHVAYSYDGERHVLYVDGARAGEGDLLPNHRTPTTSWLGTTNGANDLYKGKLDEIRIWDVLRTEQEIADEAAGNVEQGPLGLLMHLTFDESGGARVFDRSGQGNHATLGDGIPSRMPSRVPSDSPVRR